MAITFDPAKRNYTLAERGLDFADAAEVLDGPAYEFIDTRKDYGEERVTTVGLPSRAYDRRGLDLAERGPTRHFDEEGQ